MITPRLQTLLILSVSGALIGGCKTAPSAPAAGSTPVVHAQPPAEAKPVPVTPAPTPAAEALPPADTVGTLGDVYVTRAQLDEKLTESDGLNMLVELTELELARSEATRAGIVVTPADVSEETDKYTENVFKDDHQLQAMRDQIADLDRAGKAAQAELVRQDLATDQSRLLEELLQNQHVTHTSFKIAMQTLTYLRKIAEPLLKDKITDDNVRTAFNIMYGEKVRVRHIELVNLQEATEAKRRLAEGRSFEEVAREMSRNTQTAPLGGELPPFTRDTPDFPDEFKERAFALKVGEISDPVSAGSSYQLIKLEDRIAPTAIKYDDVKDSVRQTLYEKWLDQTVRAMRARLQQRVLDGIKISDPVMEAQFQAIAQRQSQVRDRDAVRRELERTRPEPTSGPGWQLLPPTSGPLDETPEVSSPVAEPAAAPQPAPQPPAVPVLPATQPATSR